MATRKSTATERSNAEKKARVRWPFPRATIEEALKIPYAIKGNNGGNPWEPDEVRKAIGAGTGGNAFFYLTAASRDYGLTTGTNTADKIALTDLGRDLVYAPTPEAEVALKIQAFLNVEIFKRVLEYYKGSNLPEMKYLGNTLQKEFGLDPETHEEFSRTFRENCQYLQITSGIPTVAAGALTYRKLGHIPNRVLWLSILMGVGSLIGVLIGAALLPLVDKHAIKALLGVILLVATACLMLPYLIARKAAP